MNKRDFNLAAADELRGDKSEHVSEIEPGGKRATGTKEWAEHSANVALGCIHDCRYCYARANALRFGKIKSVEEWKNEVINLDAVVKHQGKRKGVIMFPTAHDITDKTFDASMAVLFRMLGAGNKVLVVSKPKLDLIDSMVSQLKRAFHYPTDQLTFRFTIGTLYREVAEYWEPGAPSPEERVAAAELAIKAGYKVGFSMEPALDPTDALIQTAGKLARFTTDQVWIGTMNKIDLRWVKEGTDRDAKMMARVEDNLKPENMRRTYYVFHINPKVEWKDSYRRELNLPALPTPSER